MPSTTAPWVRIMGKKEMSVPKMLLIRLNRPMASKKLFRIPLFSRIAIQA